MIEEEAPTDYGKGGYLRINIGDTLGHQGRYVIKRKLGWGVFSTVWLAEDTKEGNHVAIKICRSDRETRETAAAEVHILKETMWHGRAQDNIVRLIDDFYHPAQRPSRLDHACLVFEVLGPNLLTFLEAHIRNVKNQEGGALPGQAGGLPLGLVKEFAKQMLAGTSYLHDFCRHIHTDLKPENIAITLPDIERIVKRDLSTTAPTSTLVETSRPARSGHRQQIVQPQQQPHLAVTADAAPADANSLQRIQIFESQPLPTPIYRLTTPRTSSDDEHCTTTNTNTTNNSAASSFQANESSTGSSSGARTISTCTGSISTTDAIPIEIGTPRDSFTRSNAARPIAIASPSSPIISTFANISRRLSTSINSLSLSSWPFARSPPTREPLAALLRPTLEDDEKEKIKLENSHNSNSTKRKVLPDLGLKIVDFGNAQPVSEVYFGRIQTRQYRAPEVIIGRRDWDRKVDVWSIACIVFELVTGDFLFDPPDESKNRDRDHVYQILELTNPFYDRRWVMGGRQSAKIFTPNGEPEVRLKYRTLRQLLEEKYHLGPFDARGLSDFLLPMLEFEPCNRANAREMVSHPWLDGTKPTRPFPPENLDEFN